MPTYPLPTLAPTVSETGISAPSYNDILQSLIAQMQSIFGSDIYLPPDSQDYQMLAVFALAIFDSNQSIIATYNAYAPTFAQGTGLSSLVKINGLARQAGTNSTAIVAIVGVVGTVITDGVVQDQNGNLWDLPTTVTIPMSGTINVTATCAVAGAIAAPPNTITSIVTVVQGWQSVTNASAATIGVAVETDSALRQRQSISTAISSVSPLEAIIAAVANVPGVSRYTIYENNTGETDGNGVPGHSISVVVEGGTTTAVAQTIEETKSPGTGTYGTTSVIVEDPAGVPITINFFELEGLPIYVSLTIQPLNGYVAQDGIDLINNIVNFINALAIGFDVYFTQIYGPANNYGNPEGQTYYVTALTIGTAPSPVGTSNIAVPFNQAASCEADHVILTVL